LTTSYEETHNLLATISEEDISFTTHFHERVTDRPITEELVKEYLQKKEALQHAEEQQARKEGERKYKLWFRMSRKYSLVVIATTLKKRLNIITAWNTERKWQKPMRK